MIQVNDELKRFLFGEILRELKAITINVSDTTYVYKLRLGIYLLLEDSDIEEKEMITIIKTEDIYKHIDNVLMMYQILYDSKGEDLIMNTLTMYDTFFLKTFSDFDVYDVADYILVSGNLNERNKYISILYSFYHHISQLRKMIKINTPDIIVKEILLRIIFDVMLLQNQKYIVTKPKDMQ